jgi:hypothetical protein
MPHLSPSAAIGGQEFSMISAIRPSLRGPIVRPARTYKVRIRYVSQHIELSARSSA